MTQARSEVVIVGSGASGLMLATLLAESGKKVVVLELGPPFGLSDLVSSQIWSRRLKWGGAPVLPDGRHPIGHNFNAGWGTGGAAMHQFGNWPRLHEDDFRVRTKWDRGLDWPIAYSDLRPYYDRVQKDFGIAGDAEAEVWRPPGDPYPMPPVRQFRHAQVMMDGFAKLGLRTAPAPVSINSVPYNGKPACIYDGWCDAGCPIGALPNPQVMYQARARAAGVELRSWSAVTRVMTNARGDRATGVEYIDRNGGRHEQLADLVVLSAFTVQNPRLLLHSATAAHPDGLANSSGLVGRYLMSHVGASVWGMFDEDIENHMGMSSAQAISQDGYVKDGRKDAFGSYTWLMGVALKPNDLLGFANARGDLFGNPLHDFMTRAARGLTRIATQAEELPNIGNRVTLSDRRDEHGVPLARLTHTLDDNALKLFAHMRVEGEAIVGATRAVERWSAPAPALAHLIGGTLMGNSAKDSVTDSYGRTHDVENLFITGSGLFPTEGGVHPTFTVHALTLRTADYLRANWRSVVA